MCDRHEHKNRTELRGRKSGSYTYTKDTMFMLHSQLNHTSSDLTIFFLHKQPLSLITSYLLLSIARRPVKAFSTTVSRCSIATLSGRLNVWITVSWARPPEWQRVRIASPPYLGHATIHSGSRPAGVDQSASKALICCDTLTLPLEDVRRWEAVQQQCPLLLE